MHRRPQLPIDRDPPNVPDNLQFLRHYLSNLDSGVVIDVHKVEEMLAKCWRELSGGTEGGMDGYKLLKRMENVNWQPPRLSFKIVRHGGTVLGSSRGEIQAWTVDIESGEAICDGTVGHRQLRPMNKPLKVEPIAKEITAAILNGQEDPRLRWKNKAEVRVLIGEIIPADAPKQTVVARRKRFWKALEEQLAQSGWKRLSKKPVWRRPADSAP